MLLITAMKSLLAAPKLEFDEVTEDSRLDKMIPEELIIRLITMLMDMSTIKNAVGHVGND